MRGIAPFAQYTSTGTAASAELINHGTHERHENKTADSSRLNFVCFVYFVVKNQ